QDGERGFEALYDIDILYGSLVHVSVFLDRPNQVRDPRSAALDFVQQGRDLQRRRDPDQGRTCCFRVQRSKQRFQDCRLGAFVRQIGSKLPQVILAVAAEQRVQLVFQNADGQGIGWRPIPLDQRGLQPFDFGSLRRGEFVCSQFVTRIFDLLQNSAQLA